MDSILLEALNKIREECNKNEQCTTCPLRDGFDSGKCVITNNTPNLWHLKCDADNRVFS